MTDTEISSLLNNFKEANKTLRSRAITIGVLFLIIFGLRYNESDRLSTVMGLSNYQNKLSDILELQDTTFKKVIDGDTEKYFPIFEPCYYCQYGNLFKRIRLNNYDRKILLAAIEEIEAKIEKVNESKSVSIMGFSIALNPLCYVFFFIMLIIFQDFTQTILFRRKVYKQLSKQRTQDWKFGNELFGFYEESDKPSLRFVRYTTSVITTCFILMPFINSMLMLNYNAYGRGYESELLIPLNIFCLVIISINTLIVFHAEDIFKLRSFAKIFLGNYTTMYKTQRSIWLITVFILGFILLETTLTSDYTTFGYKIALSFLHIALLVLLYVALVNCRKYVTKLNRSYRAFMLIVNFMWVYFVFFQTNPGTSYYIRDIQSIEGPLISLSFFAGAALVIVFVYKRYYMTDNMRAALR